MLDAFTKLYKSEKKQHEIMLNTYCQLLVLFYVKYRFILKLIFYCYFQCTCCYRTV